MNYFELFEIPVQLNIDKAAISKKFFELSRKYHPDYFANQSDDEQAAALEKSSQLNQAFKTFSDADATIKYVLQQKGLIVDEEKYDLPPDFLMEVMDINELIMDAEDENTAKELQNRIKTLQQEIYEPVEAIIKNYKEGVTTEADLLRVKEYYYKKKYLLRIQKQLGGMP